MTIAEGYFDQSYPPSIFGAQPSGDYAEQHDPNVATTAVGVSYGIKAVDTGNGADAPAADYQSADWGSGSGEAFWGSHAAFPAPDANGYYRYSFLNAGAKTVHLYVGRPLFEQDLSIPVTVTATARQAAQSDAEPSAGSDVPAPAAKRSGSRTEPSSGDSAPGG